MTDHQPFRYRAGELIDFVRHLFSASGMSERLYQQGGRYPGQWAIDAAGRPSDDPAAFAGSDAFTRQTGWLAGACRSSPPAAGVEAVRLPGQGALARKHRAMQDGLELYPGIMDAILPWAEKLNVPVPEAL
jgi:LDH2 family malate/lactate/ureidoglycolate dehydrogenase